MNVAQISGTRIKATEELFGLAGAGEGRKSRSFLGGAWGKAPWWWAGGDLNPYPLRDWVLSPARLPVPPPAREYSTLWGEDFRGVLEVYRGIVFGRE